MSYRTTVDGVQIFGNNDCYDEWYDFIRSQGIEVGEDGQYDGNITDIEGAVTALEKIAYKEAEANKTLYNFEKTFDHMRSKTKTYGMYDACMFIVENAYVFIPYNFIEIIKPKVNIYYHFQSDSSRFCHFELKPGCTVRVHAG